MRSLKFFVLFAIMLSFTSTAAFAQYGGMPNIPQMEEVSGEYVNDDIGVRITFPDGWSGIAMDTPQGTMATVAPGGMESGEVTQAMTLAMTERTNEQPKDPSDFTQQDSECDEPTSKQITVSGAQATETTMTCTDSDGKVTKVKMVLAQTETHWISAMYMAPVADYDSNVGKFDSSVKTLNILNVESMESPPDVEVSDVEITDVETTSDIEDEVKLETRNMPVSVDGKNVDVRFQTSLAITKFGLDENNKKISFTTSGDKDGQTLVSVGTVLKGPYAVTIDDEMAKDYVMADEQTLQLSLLAGTHEISISGTQVVPEFPVAVVGLIVAIIGMVAIVGRTKLFGSIRY
jgi:hypothetical protein